MNQRIYIVTNEITDVKHLVKATSQAQALGTIARDLLTVAIARPVDVVALMESGAPVRNATQEHPAHD